MARTGDFTKKTIKEIAERVGFHCSNPSCRRLTYGPKKHNTGSINMGVAAHIAAASPHGPRYDLNQTAEERKSALNGIWLCQQCSVIIDKDPSAYPVETLHNWKEIAEAAASAGLEKPSTFASGQANADTVGIVHRYRKPSKYFTVRESVPNGFNYREKVEFKRLGPIDNVVKHDVAVPVNLSASFGPSQECALFVLVLQNLGTGKEPHASISLRMSSAAIWKVESSYKNRIRIANQPEKGSTTSIIRFSVDNLMPREAVTLDVYCSNAGPFDVEAFSEAQNEAFIPYVSDVVFGELKLVKAPPSDPKFEKKQFPFG